MFNLEYIMLNCIGKPKLAERSEGKRLWEMVIMAGFILSGADDSAIYNVEST